MDDYLGPFGSQPLGNARANAAARAGHDNGFVLNAHGQLPPDGWIGLVGSMLAMLERHRLERGKAVQRFQPLLTTIAGGFDTTKGQLNAAASAVVVDEDLAAADAPLHPELAPTVRRPDPCHQTKMGGIGQFDGVV